ncbi:MAG: Ig-like domain-containing protein, partial [Campylobacterota bacterium]|nr:Ig-like domain-containing protein [Campylobacterota bacterium]
MLKIFILFLSIFLFFACSDSSDEKLVKTKFLSISKAPINNEPVSINQKISLEFSADLDISSVDDSSVYILDKNNDLVGLYIGVGNPDNKIILTPYEFLKPSSIYSIVVTTRVKDIQNRSLSQNYVYQFTTLSDTLDTTPLKIRAIKPDNGSSNILAQTNIA